MIKYLLFIIVFITTINSKAQFIISGQIRTRTEFRNGYKQLILNDDTSAFFTSQRTRLNLYYKENNITSQISIQDYRVWGNEELRENAPSVGLYQGWFQYDINKYFSFKIGRQTLNYDNSRLISGVNWNQKSASHDAMLFKYSKNGLIAHLGLAFNQTAENLTGTDYSGMNLYKQLNVLWLSKSFGKLNIASLSIVDGNQKQGSPKTIYYRYTTGITTKLKTDYSNIVYRFYYQSGKNTTGKSVNAWYNNTEISKEIFNKATPFVGIEIKSGSSYNDTQTGNDHSFDILYGSRHKFNGLIDNFSIPETTKNYGLTDVYVKIEYEFSKKSNLNLHYHYFATQQDYSNGTNTFDKSLGNELDLLFNYKISNNFSIQSALCQLFASNTLNYMQGNNKNKFSTYFFFMLTYKPVFNLN